MSHHRTARIVALGLSLYASLLHAEERAALDAPATVAYGWQDVPIGGGGYVSGVYSHPAAPGLFYAKTDVGGAYRRDGNGPWVPLTDWIDDAHWTYAGIESLALDPNDADAVYLAAGTYTNAWSGPGAFLLSHDRGRSWKTVPVPFKMGGNNDGRNQGERLAVDPNDGRVLLFGSRKNGLWTSTDRGETWSQVKAFPLPKDTKDFGTPFVLFDRASGRSGAPTPTIVIGCDSPTTPVLRSTDAGKTWTPVPGTPAGLLPHRAAFGDGGALFVTFANGVGPSDVTAGVVMRLESDGKTWTDVSPVRQGKFGYVGVTVDPRDPETILVSTLDRWSVGDAIFRSHDNGHTWTELKQNAVLDWSAGPWVALDKDKPSWGHWISGIAVDAADSDHVVYSTGWGVWEGRDCSNAGTGRPTHWRFASEGIDEGVATDVVSPPSGAPVLHTLWDLDGFRQTDIERSPKTGMFKPFVGRDNSIDFAEAEPDFVVRVFGGQILGSADAGSKGGAFSTDNGQTWAVFPSRPKDAVDGFVAVGADGKSVVWTPDGQGTAVSTDRGRTWAASSGLPWNLRVVADRRTPNAFYAFDPATGVVYASDDSAKSFKPTVILPPGDGYLRASYAAAGQVWLARASGVLRSTDGGRSFERVAGLDGGQCVGFGKPVAGPAAAAVYVVGRAGGTYGFYRSEDDGKTWTRVNDDAHQFMQIVAISGDPRTAGRVYVASRSRGIVRGDPAENK